LSRFFISDDFSLETQGRFVKKMICRKCGLDNEPDYIFCTDCGAALTESDAPKPENVTWAFSPQSRAEKLIGRVIENKYRLDSILGMGGMGTVFCSTRLTLGDKVAIKILHPELTKDTGTAERFYREAQLAARVKHPNAINIFDIGVTPDGLQFIVMEYFEGQSLHRIIKHQKPPELKFIATVTGQVCHALDEAHRQGITHRDIKPDNILVSQISGKIHVKVLDFGIAKLLDKSATNLTQTGSVMGTPQYMSPEQCMGDELDCRADIYSVGIMLYEMLCGEVPFTAPTPTAIALQHVQKTPASLLKCPHVTLKIEEVVLRALAKNPNQRQQTAGTLGYELELAVSESLGIRTPVTPITLDSVSLNKQNLGYKQFQEEAMRATPITGAETNANQPTQVNRLDALSGKQTPFSFSPGKLQPVASKKTSFGVVAAAVALLVLLAVGAGIMFLNDEKKSEDAKSEGNSEKKASKSENNSEKKASKSVEVKEAPPKTLPEPPAGMAYVPGGKFTMGGDSYIYQDEVFNSPPHESVVKPFFMDIYEVSREEYKKFLDSTNYAPPQNWNGNNFPPGTARLPVTGVTWDAANAYAKWIGKRLPTEAEWEYAARGADGRLYPWGNEWKEGVANANNINKGMVEVGVYKGASPFGIYDMVGNAWEWTATTLESYPNGTMPKIKKGINTEMKIIRGGTWSIDKKIATATRRGFYGVTGEETYSNTGFRCVRDAPQN
jgi:serine/threonine-protein kinase